MDDITLLIDGEALPITNLFDMDGEDVSSWDEAFSFVAGPRSDGKWISAECAGFQVSKLN